MQGQTILIFDYAISGRWRETQTWARIRARDNTVMLVERQQSFDELRWRGLGFGESLRRVIKGQIEDRPEGFTALRPPAGPPAEISVLSRYAGSKIRQVALGLRRKRRIRWLRRWLARKGFATTVLMVFHPFDLELVGKLGERVSCWRVYDELSEIAADEGSRDRLRKMEARGLEIVDFVFASSRSQFERRQMSHSSVHFIPNGLDSTFLDAAEREGSPGTGAAASPLAGCMGNLDWRIDFELIAATADRLPGVSFVLAGWVHPARRQEFDRVIARPNVSFLGSVPHAEIPNLLASFDVGLIPFQVDDRTRTMLPLKLFEFLGMGLPVVSTDLDEVRPYRSVTRLCSDPKEFACAVGEAIAENSSERRRERIRVAEANTWETRLQAISTIVANRLPSPPSGGP